MTQTHPSTDARRPGPARRVPAHVTAVTALAVIIGVLSAVSATVGALAQPHLLPFRTVRGLDVDLYGGGLYQYDTLLAGAGNRGTDVITLAIGIPLLAVSVLGYRRGSLRWGLMTTGAIGWFLYVYATMSVGTAFNGLFLVYVAIFSAALWGLVLSMRDVDLAQLDRYVELLPRRGPAVLMLVSGVLTALIWLIPIVLAQIGGETPAGLGVYATSVTTAIDTAVITSGALASGVLIWRRATFGYVLAFPLIVLEALLAPMIAAQTVSQLSAGMELTPAEIVGPVGGFVVLSLAAVVVLISILRALPSAASRPPLRRSPAGTRPSTSSDSVRE
jgi:hypothetical protein